MDILEKFERTIREYDMVQSGDGVLIACSGGPDSLALLHLFTRLQPGMNLNLEVFTLDHKLRPEAQQEAAMVRNLAQKWGLIYHGRAEDIKKHHQREGGSIQDVARCVRLRLLSEVATGRSLDCIALGHQADDQVETVLLNLIRGSGPTGLGGIPYQGAGRIIHPLLDIWRWEIEAYCRSFRLYPTYDPTNKEPKYRRNQVRLELVPFLEKFNPRAKEAIWRAAKLLQKDEMLLKEITKAELGNILVEEEACWEISHRAFARLPETIQLRLLHLLMQKAAPGSSFYYKHLETARLLAVSGQTGKGYDLPGQLRLERGYQTIRFLDKKKVAAVPPYNYTLSVPGSVHIPEASVSINARRACSDETWDANPQRVLIDGDNLPSELVVRNRRPGDRFLPLGAPGTKKLKDFFIENRVDQRFRDRVPLVLTPAEDIIWVVGGQIGHNYRIKESTNKKIVLELKKSRRDDNA